MNENFKLKAAVIFCNTTLREKLLNIFACVGAVDYCVGSFVY